MTGKNSDIFSQISIREYAITKQQTLANMAEYCHIYLRTPATHAFTIMAKFLLYYGLTIFGPSQNYSVLLITWGNGGEGYTVIEKSG